MVRTWPRYLALSLLAFVFPHLPPSHSRLFRCRVRPTAIQPSTMATNSTTDTIWPTEDFFEAEAELLDDELEVAPGASPASFVEESPPSGADLSTGDRIERVCYAALRCASTTPVISYVVAVCFARILTSTSASASVFAAPPPPAPASSARNVEADLRALPIFFLSILLFLTWSWCIYFNFYYLNFRLSLISVLCTYKN